jgi:hypothetical protein
MKFMIKSALALIPALALVTPALAQRPANLADPQQPGSVIVYPKFVNELFNGGSPIIVDGQTVAQTEIEIGAVCPPGFVNAGGFCPQHEAIKIRFHWVCPGIEGVNSNICPEEDFEVNITVNGKLAFSANGLPINGNSPPLVPAPPCARGFLIGWVENTSDQPIKFDGLIGNAVIRGGNLAAGPNAGSSTAVSAYSAVTIQADPALANLAPIPLAAGGALPFGGAGGYTTVTGVQIGDVRFDKTAPGLPLPNVLSRTSLTFIGLDLLSDRPNSPIFVPLNFYNESLGSAVGSTNPAFEHLTSTFTEFVCWTQVPLSALAGGNLTQAFQGTRKGVVIAGPANKVSDGNAPGDAPGPVTLIGLVETIEGTAPNAFMERKYNFNMYSNLLPIGTCFGVVGIGNPPDLPGCNPPLKVLSCPTVNCCTAGTGAGGRNAIVTVTNIGGTTSPKETVTFVFDGGTTTMTSIDMILPHHSAPPVSTPIPPGCFGSVSSDCSFKIMIDNNAATTQLGSCVG